MTRSLVRVRRRAFAFLSAVSAAMFSLNAVTPAFAQTPAANEFPSKPVRFIAGSAPGGTGDVLTRILADAMTPIWKQPVFVENRAGGGGVIAMQALLSAPNDNHTLLIAAGSSLTIAPFTLANIPYDVERDFTPIAFVAEIPILMAANAKLPLRSVGDLIAEAKAHPDKLTFSANTAGTFPHLATELFEERAGIKMTFVSYKGSSAALPDAMAGRIDLIVEGLAALAPGIKAGTLRPLGVTSADRLPSLPDVQAIGEVVPGYHAVGFYAVMGPANMPPALVLKAQ